jgi:hypothetical protein
MGGKEMKLYELANEYRELENMDLDADTLADTLESLEGEFDAKADAICHVLANLQAQRSAIIDELSRLEEREGRVSVNIDGLKDYLRDNMEKLGKKKIESAKFTINCVAGRDKVRVYDEVQILDQYFTVVPESKKLDKRMLLADLKEGFELEGVELEKSKSSLRIK